MLHYYYRSKLKYYVWKVGDFSLKHDLKPRVAVLRRLSGSLSQLVASMLEHLPHKKHQPIARRLLRPEAFVALVQGLPFLKCTSNPTLQLFMLVTPRKLISVFIFSTISIL